MSDYRAVELWIRWTIDTHPLNVGILYASIKSTSILQLWGFEIFISIKQINNTIDISQLIKVDTITLYSYMKKAHEVCPHLYTYTDVTPQFEQVLISQSCIHFVLPPLQTHINSQKNEGHHVMLTHIQCNIPATIATRQVDTLARITHTHQSFRPHGPQ